MRLFCLLTIAWLSSLPALAQPDLLNGMRAIVNDAIITQQEVEIASFQAVQSAARAYGPDSEQFHRKTREAQKDAIDLLIERQLILSDFNSGGRVLPESIIDDRIKDIIRAHYGDRAHLTQTLKAENTTFDTFRQRTRDDLIVQIMDRHFVRESILISPAKIQRYYETNLATYQLADQVKLRVIVLKREGGSTADEVRTLAREILDKIEGGAPFAEMASTYSEGSQRKEGGDWGWWEESKLSKGTAELVGKLKTGAHTGVFSLAREADDSYWVYEYDKTGKLTTGRKYTAKEEFAEEKKFDQVNHDGLPAIPFEFRLMQVDDRKAAHTRPLPELRDEIERELIAQEKVRLRKVWIDRLRAKSFVRQF